MIIKIPFHSKTDNICLIKCPKLTFYCSSTNKWFTIIQTLTQTHNVKWNNMKKLNWKTVFFVCFRITFSPYFRLDIWHTIPFQLITLHPWLVVYLDKPMCQCLWPLWLNTVIFYLKLCFSYMLLLNSLYYCYSLFKNGTEETLKTWKFKRSFIFK